MNIARESPAKRGGKLTPGAETIKTTGVVLQIRPYSRTSHVVTWLTPDHGPVATLVKGAVRPKSAFLGQYDFFYTCELLYYARGRGSLHPLREAVAIARRDGLRGRWRETALAGYAADLMHDLAPSSAEARQWYLFLSRFLDDLAGSAQNRPLACRLTALEMEVLRLSGLSPDFTGIKAPWTAFAIERGGCGEGERTVRLTPAVVAALKGEMDGDHAGAVRFLGMFLAYHLDRPAYIRRTLLGMIG